MILSDISIRRPVFAWMLMAACIIFGGISLSRLGISQLPDVTMPIITVSDSWTGASPEVLEKDIANPLEDALVSIQGVKSIETTMMQGSVRLKLEFYTDQDINAALQSVNSKVQSVTLPDQADPPTVQKLNMDARPILWLGLTGNCSFHDLVTYADLHLRDKFQIIPGVGTIQFGGWADRTMRVWVDADKLTRYNLTILDVRDTLLNDYNEVASGLIENNRQEINVRTMGEVRSAEDIAKLAITRRGGAPIIDSQIHIGDVATVDDGLADIRRFSRAEGKANIGIGIQKQVGYNEVEVADKCKALAAELNKHLPPGMELAPRFDSTKFTKAAVDETEFTLILSALITSLVCWAFLGSWSSTLNILLSIPTSILGAFIVIYFMGFTLNFFTLLGLSLAIGIVVDDAIMVLENIVRHFHMGKTKEQAALDGAREITFAAMAATVSVVAIFAPTFFAQGMAGVFLYQFGVTISAAVLISLLEAITLTPMRCSQFMQEPKQENPVTRWIGRGFHRSSLAYARTLDFCLHHRWKVVGISSFVFAASLLLFFPLRKELIPAQDVGIVILSVQSNPGSSLERTSDLIKPLEDYIDKQPYVADTFLNVGGFGGGQITQGNIFITLVDRSKRKLSQQEIVKQLRAHFPRKKGGGKGKDDGLVIQVIDVSQGAFSSKRGTSIELSLQGPEYSVLHEKSQEIIKAMEKSGEFQDIDTDYREGAPELHIIPDREKAAASNVSIQAISETVNAAIGGIRAGKYTNDDRRYDLRIRLKPDQWQSPKDLDKLMVRTGYGELIPLSSVTKTEMAYTVLSITRENRARAITLYANNKPEISQQKAINDAVKISDQILPEGYSAELTGFSQTNRESFSEMGMIFVLGFVVAYMILAAQFNSFIHPVTVLIALPFTFTGALLALFLTNASINLYSGIGLILLMGIAKKNSILLVEFFNKLRYEHGRTPYEAILQGGPIRLRPIIMTSAATIAAAIPSAVGVGPGSEVRVPLSIVVIGGILVSTFFTLFVIPCVYSIFTAIEAKRG